MPEFRMPSLGADMEVGTILEWLVHPGDEVHRGDVVAVVDTAKAAVEVEVFTDGTIDEIVVPVGQQVPVGTLLATLSPVGAVVPAPAVPPQAPAAPVADLVPEPVTLRPAPLPTPAAAPAPGGRVASPLVRHLAHQHGIGLETVTGTGPAGAVTREDVERVARVRTPARGGDGRRREHGAPRTSPYARRRAQELGVDLTALPVPGAGVVRAADVERAAGERPPAPPPAPPPPARGPQDSRQQGLRQTIAALMARSKREVPHYYLSNTVDLERATAWLRETNATRPVPERLLSAALLLKATALACREAPDLNGFWRDGGPERADRVHLGVVIALRGGGLVAPAIHDADTLPVDELMTRLRDLVGRTRAGRLRNSELTDATITVTNLGDLGVDVVHGVIFPPQVAIVGFGRVVERPWAVDGLLGVRPVVTTTLAADHRATDGHVGARLLSAVDRLLQDPARL